MVMVLNMKKNYRLKRFGDDWTPQLKVRHCGDNNYLEQQYNRIKVTNNVAEKKITWNYFQLSLAPFKNQIYVAKNLNSVVYDCIVKSTLLFDYFKLWKWLYHNDKIKWIQMKTISATARSRKKCDTWIHR